MNAKAPQLHAQIQKQLQAQQEQVVAEQQKLAAANSDYLYDVAGWFILIGKSSTTSAHTHTEEREREGEREGGAVASLGVLSLRPPSRRDANEAKRRKWP